MFSWIKWPNESRAQSPHSRTLLKTSGATASHILIRELLFHAEELQRLRERKQGALGLSWFQKYPKFQTVLTTAEQQQLEFLCAQIPPAYAATVLSRFREVLAANTVRPWELPSVFKHVMKDILRQKEYDEEDILSWQAGQHQEMEAWTSCYRMKQGFLTSTVPNCDHPREEIPTISGYVDWAMRQSSSFTGSSGGWGPPYYSHCYPVPLRPIGAYSTSL
ncbi:protein RD3-like [Takifugu flavidus]|uniref:Protein RD3-like n=1 Tax=Takifugu flavidus TaxID=433684 RepID=A0A5C6P1X7_9TELE|nr:protein RD3-like [Takifugu flavidus]TWW72097.1 hypothetical protein D4764_16G0005940 [Takifugu flavidus]